MFNCCLIITLLFAFTLPVFALPILSEVLYDGIGSDRDEVSTEIVGEPYMSLKDWSLLGLNGHNGGVYRTIQLNNIFIPADGILVLATADAQGLTLASRDYIAEVDWQNGPDTIHLIDPLGKLIDAIQYGDAGIFNAGFGSPTADTLPGYSLFRHTLDPNRFVGDNSLDFFTGVLPTPGSIPMPVVPELDSLVLLSSQAKEIVNFSPLVHRRATLQIFLPYYLFSD